MQRSMLQMAPIRSLWDATAATSSSSGADDLASELLLDEVGGYIANYRPGTTPPTRLSYAALIGCKSPYKSAPPHRHSSPASIENRMTTTLHA